LKVPEDRRNFLGRWLPKQSDNYLLSARAVVLGIHDEIMVAFHANPLVFDETEVLGQISQKMVDMGRSPEDVASQLERLSAPLRAYKACRADESEHSENESVAPAAVIVGPVVDGVLVPVPEVDCRAQGLIMTGEAIPKYVISYTRKRKSRTIHKFREGCYRRVGYEISDSCYTSVLEAGDWAFRCKDCWNLRMVPRAALEDARDVHLDSATGSDDSSSSED
jgi:hypothetical protein